MEDYKVAVKLTLINDVTAGLVAIAAQFKGLNASADAFSAKLTKIKSFMMIGASLATGGFALAAPFIYATAKAAELQKQLLGIQVATAGTASQMTNMQYAIEKAASTTQFSITDVAKMAKTIATSNTFQVTPGHSRAEQVSSLLPAFSKFADVQYLLKGTPYSQSIIEAVRLAHTAQLFTPKAISSYLNTLTKASIVMPGSITEIGNALKYSQGTAQQVLGVAPKQMILLTALLNRLGFSGSRGGTNTIAAMTRTIPGIFGSGLLSGKSNEALREMGLTDSKGHSKLFTNGKFDVVKWMQGLSAFEAKEMNTYPEAIARQKITIAMQHAFGTQGRRIAALLASPQALKQFYLMAQQFEALASTGAIQDVFVKKSVSQQFTTAMTNFQAVIINLGTALLPLATDLLNRLNAGLNKLIPWMRKNKELIKEISYAFLGLAAALTIAGTIGIFAGAILAMTTPLGLVVVGFTALVGLFHALEKMLPKSYRTGGLLNTIGDTVLPGASAPLVSLVKVFLDGKQISHSVTKHQADVASRQPSHGSVANSNISLLSNMYSTPF